MRNLTMINLTQAEESSLNLRLKKSLLNSSKILGCRLSEFEVVEACKKPSRLDAYWVDFAWESEKNLRMRLAFKKHQAYLEQTFEKTHANFPVRWGKGLTPALQFSSEGICQITQQEARQLVQQFSELPALPPPEKSRKWEISLGISEPLFMPGFAAADGEEPWIVLGLETLNPQKKYEERDKETGKTILRCRLIGNEWVVDFLTPTKSADNKVKLIMVNHSKTEILNETQELVYEDKRWRFRYVLPQSIVDKVTGITVIPSSSR